MKLKHILLAFLLYLIIVFSSHARQDDFPILKGSYLGQKPPGLTPEVFASEIIASANFVEFKGAFSRDGMKYYFYRFLHKLRPTLFFSVTKVIFGGLITR